MIDITIRDGDELIINGIQNNNADTISGSQMVLNMSTSRAQYASIGNTVIITFRSQKTGPAVVNMPNVILKFSYITQGIFLLLPKNFVFDTILKVPN